VDRIWIRVGVFDPENLPRYIIWPIDYTKLSINGDLIYILEEKTAFLIFKNKAKLLYYIIKDQGIQSRRDFLKSILFWLGCDKALACLRTNDTT